MTVQLQREETLTGVRPSHFIFLAALLVDCWEGAALRSRIRGNPAPLTAMLDFYFRAALQ